MELLRKELRTTSGGKILDVATGTGGFISVLVNAFRNYREAIGIDTSLKLINKAKENVNGDNVTFEIMNAERLAFKDDSFDTVAIRDSLHHLDHPVYALDEMKRVLKTGGLFILCEIIQDRNSKIPNPHTELHHWFAAIDRLSGITHNETFTWQQITELVKKLELRGLEFFEYAEPIDNSNHRQIIESYAQKCDLYLNRIKDNPKFKKLCFQGDRLKRDLLTTDFSWAPELYLLGWK